MDKFNLDLFMVKIAEPYMEKKILWNKYLTELGKSCTQNKILFLRTIISQDENFNPERYLNQIIYLENGKIYYLSIMIKMEVKNEIISYVNCETYFNFINYKILNPVRDQVQIMENLFHVNMCEFNQKKLFKLIKLKFEFLRYVYSSFLTKYSQENNFYKLECEKYYSDYNKIKKKYDTLKSEFDKINKEKENIMKTNISLNNEIKKLKKETPKRKSENPESELEPESKKLKFT